MNTKPENVLLILLAIVILWCMYKNQTNEGFCPGPDCQVTHNWPYIKLWEGRDGQSNWGNNWYMNESHHPSLPYISNYDNRPYTYTDGQKVGIGCPKKAAAAVKPVVEEPDVPAGPLCLNCPSNDTYMNDRELANLQHPDYPLPQNHKDMVTFYDEGAPVVGGTAPFKIRDMTVPQNNGGNGNKRLDNLPQPESGVIEELTDRPVVVTNVVRREGGVSIWNILGLVLVICIFVYLWRDRR